MLAPWLNRDVGHSFYSHKLPNKTPKALSFRTAPLRSPHPALQKIRLMHEALSAFYRTCLEISRQSRARYP
jgi:hypothetical protein